MQEPPCNVVLKCDSNNTQQVQTPMKDHQKLQQTETASVPQPFQTSTKDDQKLQQPEPSSPSIDNQKLQQSEQSVQQRFHTPLKDNPQTERVTHQEHNQKPSQTTENK